MFMPWARPMMAAAGSRVEEEEGLGGAPGAQEVAAPAARGDDVAAREREAKLAREAASPLSGLTGQQIQSQSGNAISAAASETIAGREQANALQANALQAKLEEMAPTAIPGAIPPVPVAPSVEQAKAPGQAQARMGYAQSMAPMGMLGLGSAPLASSLMAAAGPAVAQGAKQMASAATTAGESAANFFSPFFSWASPGGNAAPAATAEVGPALQEGLADATERVGSYGPPNQLFGGAPLGMDAAPAEEEQPAFAPEVELGAGVNARSLALPPGLLFAQPPTSPTLSEPAGTDSANPYYRSSRVRSLPGSGQNLGSFGAGPSLRRPPTGITPDALIAQADDLASKGFFQEAEEKRKSAQLAIQRETQAEMTNRTKLQQTGQNYRADVADKTRNLKILADYGMSSEDNAVKLQEIQSRVGQKQAENFLNYLGKTYATDAEKTVGLEKVRAQFADIDERAAYHKEQAKALQGKNANEAERNRLVGVELDNMRAKWAADNEFKYFNAEGDWYSEAEDRAVKRQEIDNLASMQRDRLAHDAQQRASDRGLKEKLTQKQLDDTWNLTKEKFDLDRSISNEDNATKRAEFFARSMDNLAELTQEFMLKSRELGIKESEAKAFIEKNGAEIAVLAQELEMKPVELAAKLENKRAELGIASAKNDIDRERIASEERVWLERLKQQKNELDSLDAERLRLASSRSEQDRLLGEKIEIERQKVDDDAWFRWNENGIDANKAIMENARENRALDIKVQELQEEGRKNKAGEAIDEKKVQAMLDRISMEDRVALREQGVDVAELAINAWLGNKELNIKKELGDSKNAAAATKASEAAAQAAKVMTADEKDAYAKIAPRIEDFIKKINERPEAYNARLKDPKDQIGYDTTFEALPEDQKVRIFDQLYPGGGDDYKAYRRLSDKQAAIGQGLTLDELYERRFFNQPKRPITPQEREGNARKVDRRAAITAARAAASASRPPQSPTLPGQVPNLRETIADEKQAFQPEFAGLPGGEYNPLNILAFGGSAVIPGRKAPGRETPLAPREIPSGPNDVEPEIDISQPPVSFAPAFSASPWTTQVFGENDVPSVMSDADESSHPEAPVVIPGAEPPMAFQPSRRGDSIPLGGSVVGDFTTAELGTIRKFANNIDGLLRVNPELYRRVKRTLEEGTEPFTRAGFRIAQR